MRPGILYKYDTFINIYINFKFKFFTIRVLHYYNDNMKNFDKIIDSMSMSSE